ncbi:MAG TPA: MBL fold metallo-hydrolase [Phycisphaerales bacterium]|nr:MBL fold metallo-hydrolase [Phycisphaerales bacterium]
MGQRWRWRLLRAGSLRLDGGGMFGVVPKTLWSRMAEADEQNRIGLQTNCLLLESESGEKTLIETGFGGKWSEKERGFYALEKRTVEDALQEVGLRAEEIGQVIVTHLHFDHAGGLTKLNTAGEVVRTFPNARVFVQKLEWEDALANKSTMTKTYLRNHLDPIAGCVELVDGEREILPGVTVWPVPGHTWGQHAVRFEDEQGVVCFAGDVIPTANHVGLAFSIGYDMMPYENMLTKKKLLERAEREAWRLALDHEPGHAVMRVKHNEGGKFTFEQA